MTRPNHYAEDPPPAALAGAVRNLWSFTASADLAPGPFALPPDPCLSLAVVRMGPRLGLRIEYQTRFDAEGRWVETGRMTFDDGATWRPFFEMTLTRVE